MRIDYIFSYWIFFWYLLYIFGIVTSYNPKFAIFCGLIENFVLLLSMLYFGTKKKLVFLFLIMSVLLKIIPLISIWNTKMNITDIYATAILFGIYLFYVLWINKKTLHDFTEQTKNLILHNKNTLPGMMFLSRLGL